MLVGSKVRNAFILGPIRVAKQPLIQPVPPSLIKNPVSPDRSFAPPSESVYVPLVPKLDLYAWPVAIPGVRDPVANFLGFRGTTHPLQLA